VLGLHLRELTLNNFRNYKQVTVGFDCKKVLLTGKNAQGKTNILESIFLACTGRSHRTTKDSELIRLGQESCSLRIEVERKTAQFSIDINISRKDKKKIQINGMAIQRIGQLMGHLNGVMFSPEDMKIVKEAPSERRRYMDMEISQIKPQYFYYLQQYNRILIHRNNLLKQINKNGSLKKMLGVFDEQLAEAGAFIIKERYVFIKKLSAVAKEIHKKISSDTEELGISYKPSVKVQNYDIESIQQEFLSALEKIHPEDIQRGNTGVGCHRDDISFELNGMDVKIFGSQGQQRTVALSLKLSDIELMYGETGEYPVLLLDDVMSELDEERQSKLFQEIGEVQTFVTATDFRSIPPEELKKFEIFVINEGKIKKKTNYVNIV
jgi:DNA replication and repair protein RecF